MDHLIFQHGLLPSCHASSVLKTPDALLVAYFAGSREGAGDVRIYLSRDEGEGFAPPVCVASEQDLPHWNPVLYSRRDGKILLYYKVGEKISHWRTFVRESRDDGKSWSKERELIPGDASGGRGPVRNHPIRLSDGRVLAGASAERESWRIFIDISRDDGYSYSREEFIPFDLPEGAKGGLIQPALWQDDAGAVHLFARSSLGAIYKSSAPDGVCFSKAKPTDLPNNNSGIDLCRTKSGALVLALNPVRGNWGARTPLCLMVSTDNGESFSHVKTLEDNPGEYSYPSLCAEGNTVYYSYTHNRTNIVSGSIRLGDE